MPVDTRPRVKPEDGPVLKVMPNPLPTVIARLARQSIFTKTAASTHMLPTPDSALGEAAF
jgi:hypothetical protein